MCAICTELIEQMTPRDANVVSRFLATIFTHFISDSEEGPVWDMGRVSSILLQYVDDETIKAALLHDEAGETVQSVFAHGATAALEMLSNASRVASVKVAARTDEDLAALRDALEAPEA